MVLSPLQLPKDTVQVSNADDNESGLYEGPELRTYDLDEEVMDVDSEHSLSNGDGMDFIPKTMQQLAEDAARRDMQQKEAELRNGEDKKHNSVGLDGAREEGLAVVLNSESSGRVTRSRSGAVKNLTLASGAPEKMVRGRRSMPLRQKAASTNKISRKRKRAVEDGSEPEPEVDAETSNDEQEDIDFVGDDTTGGGDGDDDGEYKSTRGKRSRIGQRGNTRSTRPRARPSTRAFHTPRSRRAKTTSQFEEES